MLYSRKLLHSPFAIRDKFFDLDFTLMISILLLGVISIFAQYSSSGGQFDYHSKSHAIRFCVFFLFFLTVSFINIRFWNDYSLLIFISLILLLVAVKFWGVQSQGSRRWINLFVFNLQPSELMKVGIILFLSNYYHKISSGDVNKIRYLFYPLLALLIPFMLVASQPDLGTAILILVSGIVITWLSGVKWRIFAYLSGLFIVLAPIAISFLKPYQKLRILTFLNPDRDPLGSGYQIIQSKIAVGSGGFTGKGFLQGTQSYLEFLPEKHTDFIFTLFAEEHGFLGSLGLLLIYIIIIYRIIKIGTISRSYFSKLFCFGYGSAIFFYVSVNMSMVLGLLPIVGSPLPIMSYGGSSMLATMIGFSIVMSAKINHKQLIA